jgi:hypothetical protein
MVYDICLTKNHSQHAKCMSRGTNQAIHCNNHPGTDLIGHGSIINQGITDGNMAVIANAANI